MFEVLRSMPGLLFSDGAQTRAQSVALRTAFALPEGVRRTLAGKPVRIDGQELALDAQLLLKLQQLSGHTELSGPTVENARTKLRLANQAVNPQRVDGVKVNDKLIPTRSGELAARLYRPLRGTSGSTSGLLVFFHGGGFVIGDLDGYDDFCRFLAKHSGVSVLSVDYRLAPEHPFPAAFEDAVDAYEYAVDHAGELDATPESVAVGGDSAGGNLAAAVAQHALHSGTHQPAFQLLLYPAVDATTRRRSRELFGNGFLISDRDLDWFMDHYLAEVERRGDPRLSVLLADDLTGLPPAYVVTAGFDPLRDEGEAYAQRLEESGVPVVARRFPDLIHGFISLRQAGTRFNEALFEIAGGLRTGMSLRV